MEIKVNIPANDYVQPSEIREDVVQMICTYIVEKMNDNYLCGEGIFNLYIDHNYWEYKLYLETYKGKPYLLRCKQGSNEKFFEQIRIRGCEMDAVFDALLNAGYFIFETRKSDGKVVYTFSKKSYYSDRTAARATVFGLFID